MGGVSLLSQVAPPLLEAFDNDTLTVDTVAPIVPLVSRNVNAV